MTITNAGTGETLQMTSTEEGVFVVAEVKPGTYQITAETAGFKKVSVEGVIVQVVTVSSVNIELEVGAVSEQVTVTAADTQEVVNTSNAEVGDLSGTRGLFVGLVGLHPTLLNSSLSATFWEI